MSGQAIAAIIAFTAAVIVAILGYWFNQKIERRKQVAQLASTAFIDGVTAIAENQRCMALLGALRNHLSEDEKAHWRRRPLRRISHLIPLKPVLRLTGTVRPTVFSRISNAKAVLQAMIRSLDRWPPRWCCHSVKSWDSKRTISPKETSLLFSSAPHRRNTKGRSLDGRGRRRCNQTAEKYRDKIKQAFTAKTRSTHAN